MGRLSAVDRDRGAIQTRNRPKRPVRVEDQLTEQLADYQTAAEKGVPGGYASLDGSGTVPDAQIPSAVARDVEVTAAVAAHVALADPHTQYRLESASIGTGDLANNAVTLAKLAQASATDKLLGRATASVGNYEEIACTAAARSILDDATVAAILDTLGVARKISTANVALAASTTKNITELDLTVAAGETWILDYKIAATVSGGTAGLKPIFTLPAGTTGTMDQEGTTSAATAYTFGHSATPGTAGTAFITASFTGTIYVRAVLTFTASGTCRFGVATGASAAGNLLAGASLIATRI